jgi:hypothetical protein
MDELVKSELTQLLTNLSVPRERRALGTSGNLEWLVRNLHQYQCYEADRAKILATKLLRDRVERRRQDTQQQRLFE